MKQSPDHAVLISTPSPDHLYERRIDSEISDTSTLYSIHSIVVVFHESYICFNTGYKGFLFNVKAGEWSKTISARCII